MLLLQSVVNVHFLFSFLEKKKGIKAVTSAVPLKMYIFVSYVPLKAAC